MENKLKDILLFVGIFALIAFLAFFFNGIIAKNKKGLPNCKFLESYTSEVYGVKAKIANVNADTFSSDAYSILTYVEFEPIDGIVLSAYLPYDDMEKKDVSNVDYNICNLKVAKEIQDYVNSNSNIDTKIISLSETDETYEFTLTTSVSSQVDDSSISFGHLKKGKDASQIEFDFLCDNLKRELKLDNTNN